jgi:hypothetical protein
MLGHVTFILFRLAPKGEKAQQKSSHGTGGVDERILRPEEEPPLDRVRNHLIEFRYVVQLV